MGEETIRPIATCGGMESEFEQPNALKIAAGIYAGRERESSLAYSAKSRKKRTARRN